MYGEYVTVRSLLNTYIAFRMMHLMTCGFLPTNMVELFLSEFHDQSAVQGLKGALEVTHKFTQKGCDRAPEMVPLHT